MNHLPLCFVILLLFVLIFVSRKEGLDTKIDEEIIVPVTKNDLIASIQILNRLKPGDTNRPFGDAWLNLGDITIRDKAGKKIDYANTNKVYFASRKNWTGNWNGYTELPVKYLWDENKTSMAHANKEYEDLIIDLTPVAVGSVQITNRSDCCERRIGNYELTLFNSDKKSIGYVRLDNLVGLGKTVLYKMSYPR
jgi:hypothetical protein